MLTVEIENIGGIEGTLYRYLVKVNRNTIAAGTVEHGRASHWSSLLAAIAKNGKTPERHTASVKESS